MNDTDCVEKFQDAYEDKVENQKVIRIVRFSNELNFVGHPICTIDLLEFQVNEPCIILPDCKHIFHSSCLEEWLQSYDNERKCPNCNYELVGFILIK